MANERTLRAINKSKGMMMYRAKERDVRVTSDL